VKADLDIIESQRELTLIDYVRIFGILIFVSVACLCIALFALRAKSPAAILAQEPITNVATETTRAEPNIKAKVQGAATVAPPDPHYIALVSSYAQSASETPNLQAKPSLQRVKAIREHHAEHRRPTADLSRRSASFGKDVPRSIKMLIEMWASSSGKAKNRGNGVYAYGTTISFPSAAHSQRFHGEFLPLELHHFLHPFGTVVGHAHDLDPELHRLALPYGQNRTSRSLTSCRLKRSG
jgi:hypothetical protein